MSYRDNRISHLVNSYWRPELLEIGKRRRHILIGRSGEPSKFAAGNLLLRDEFRGAYEVELKPHLHTMANHLNSSQMFCFNLFQPLRSKFGMKVLSGLLQRWLGLVAGPNILDTQFEYEPESAKPRRTNFDFFVQCDKIKVYFEVKYTEASYGGVNRGKRSEADFEEWKRTQWQFYGTQLKRSKYLREFASDEFFAKYQILRNVAYVTEANWRNEYVVFLSPSHNKGAKLIPQIVNGDWSHVRTVDVEQIREDVRAAGGKLPADMRKDIESYYQDFCDFYFG